MKILGSIMKSRKRGGDGSILKHHPCENEDKTNTGDYRNGKYGGFHLHQSDEESV